MSPVILPFPGIEDPQRIDAHPHSIIAHNRKLVGALAQRNMCWHARREMVAVDVRGWATIAPGMAEIAFPPRGIGRAVDQGWELLASQTVAPSAGLGHARILRRRNKAGPRRG